jgi:hypothetical protein
MNGAPRSPASVVPLSGSDKSFSMPKQRQLRSVSFELRQRMKFATMTRGIAMTELLSAALRVSILDCA